METLLKALRTYDIEPPKGNIDSGNMHRWGHNNRYWARRFDGGYVFGDFVIGLSMYAFNRSEREYSKAELRILRANMEKARKEAEIEQEKMYEETALKANRMWNNATPLISHSYLAKKQVSSYGLREYKGCIMIPLYDENNKTWSLQFIDAEGDKRFLSDGKKKGCYYIIGDPRKSERIFICEGYATGATVHECTEEAVVIAFCTTGLKSVACIIRKKYPNVKVVIYADNDGN
jgi:putative DNA primase/helicase